MRPIHQGCHARLFAAVLSLLAASCQAPVSDQANEADQDAAGQVESGRQIAVANCSSCHAIDDQRASPRPGAPPLLSILLRYDGDQLANDFIQGVRVGHDEMPHFDFNVRAADALIAYLKAIERTPRAAEH